MKQKHLTRLLIVLAMVLSVVLIGSASATLTDGQLIRGDVNGDGAITMKDVLLLRKYLADMDVEIADHICTTTPGESQPVETQPGETTPSESVTTPVETQPGETTPSESVTVPVETQPVETQPGETTPSESVTAPVETQPSESQSQPAETQATQSQPTQGETTQSQPTQSQATQAQTTQSQPTDSIKVQMNLTELKTKYASDVQTRTDSFYVAKGEKVTLVLSYPDVYHATNAVSEGTAAGWFDLKANGTAITPVITSESNTKVFATYDLGTATTDITITGEVKKSGNSNKIEDFDEVVISVNGQSSGGSTPTGGTQSGAQTSATSAAPIVAEGDQNIDLVTLTYGDLTASEYGVSFHSFTALSNPVVQIVSGEVSDKSAFTSATEVSATSTTKSIKEHQDYNPATYEFTYDYANRSKIVTSGTTYIHKAQLTGLNYGATYSYRVGDKTTGTWSPIYTFKTRAQTVSDFSFIYTADTQPDLGDKQGYKGVYTLLNKAFGIAPNAAFLVSGGDFVYCSDEGQGSVSMWRNVINGCNNFNTGAAGSLFAEHPWMITNGNHDNDYVQDFLNNAVGVANKDCYSYDYGNCHFVVLDSGHNGSLDNSQLTWLSSDLSSTTKKFKIVFLHWPFYCHEERDLTGTSRNAIDTFEKYGVDFVISAHVNEDYYTTYPLKDDAVGTKTYTTQNGVKYFAGGNGPIYLQNAASGLGSDLKGGEKGVMYTGKKDGGKTCSYPELMLHDAIAGYESSFMIVDVTSDKVTLNRYYLDKSLNAVKYTDGQVGVTR